MTETLLEDAPTQTQLDTAPTPRPEAIVAVKLLDVRHVTDPARGEYAVQMTWAAPPDRSAARQLFLEPVTQSLRELNLDSITRYRELCIDQAGIAKRLTLAKAVLAEQQAKRARLTAEGRSGVAPELVKTDKAIAKAQEDIAVAESERDSITPLVNAARQTARDELRLAENQAGRIRRAEVDAEHARIVAELTATIAPQLFALKRLSCAVANPNASVGEGILHEIDREAGRQ